MKGKNLWEKSKGFRLKVFLSHRDKTRVEGNEVWGNFLKGWNSDVKESIKSLEGGGRKWAAKLFDGGLSYLNEICSN